MKTNYYNEYLNEVMNDERIALEQFFATSYEEVQAMSQEERDEVRAICEEHMNANDNFNRYYKVYMTVSDVEDAEFYEDNESEIRAYFKKWFAGKTWDDICNNDELRERWDFYSDYHKDVFGFRPHAGV